MTRNEVISKVMICIDEAAPSFMESVTLDGNELTNPVMDYVDKLLDDATDDVRMIAPINRLSKTDLPWTPTLADYKGISCFKVDVPSDFLRIAMVKMATWDRAVIRTVSADSEEYRLVRNPHTTAGSSKPVIAFIDKVLEVYGGLDADKEYASYIHREYFTSIDLSVDDLVAEAICWRCAVKVLSVMGNELAKQAVEHYNFTLQKLAI